MIKQITFKDYPSTLKNMHNPPKKLWMRGSLPEFDSCKYLCVIGSRTPSTYGLDATDKLISGLAGYPISIVSGLAIGIDSLSHEVGLKAGLHCIAYPGSGLDWGVIYPHSKSPLAKKIVNSGGALLSEYPPRFPFTQWTFAARNKLMAGMSNAVLIIEGRQGSGTLMTADYALEMNRDVLVVPGSIFSDLSYGPHMLFERGATPIFSSVDILRALGFKPEVQKALSHAIIDSLEPILKEIVQQLRFGEITVDELMSKLIIKLPINYEVLNEKLSILELDGLIKNDNGFVRLI